MDDWAGWLDPESQEWCDLSTKPFSGVRRVERNGSRLLCVMFDADGLVTSAPDRPGMIVWRLISRLRQTRIHINAHFIDKRFAFAHGDTDVHEGGIVHLELRTEEPHPERQVLFPASRSRSLAILNSGFDELVTDVSPRNWDPLRLTCTAHAEATPSPAAVATKPTSDRLNPKASTWLVYCTEWDSRNGGLSTFNREFCIGLAKAGHNVFLRMVPSLGEESNLPRSILLRLNLSKSELPQSCLETLGTVKPDVVVGHDRISGPLMLVEAEQIYNDAKRVLFIHTDPVIEVFGDSDDAAAGAAQEAKRFIQDDLMRRCGWVVAVGPRLHRHVLRRVVGFESKPMVVRFDPAIREIDEAQLVDQESEFRLLMMARSNDATLKGRALSSIFTKLANEDVRSRTPLLPSTDSIFLSIAGVAEADIAAVTRELGVSRGRVTGYVVARNNIAEEFRRSHLIVMPSHEEGFGFVALEAIEASRPILVTKNSGIAEFLLERCSDPDLRKYVNAMIVEDNGSKKRNREELWAGRIVESVQTYETMREGVRRVRLRLLSQSWEKSVNSLLKDLMV